MVRYAQIDSATYIPTSPNEVIVKGGLMEGFSILLEDPDERGITFELVTAACGGATLHELHTELLQVDPTLSVNQLQKMLDILVDAGALKKLDDTSSHDNAWQTFVRYGEVPQASYLQPLAIVSDEDVRELVVPLSYYGVDCTTYKHEDFDFAAFRKSAADGQEDPDPNIPATVSLSMFSSRISHLEFNEHAVQNNVSVLYADLDLVDFTIGPYVVPGKTACWWETERQWSRASADYSQYEMFTRYRLNGANKPEPTFVGKQAFIAALIPWLLELSLRGTSSLVSEVAHGRATTGDTSRHSIMRLPRCPVCLPLQPLLRNPLY